MYILIEDTNKGEYVHKNNFNIRRYLIGYYNNLWNVRLEIFTHWGIFQEESTL